MAEPQYLSVARLAARYSVPEATIRSWRDRFRPFLPQKTQHETLKVGSSGIRSLGASVGYDVERFDVIHDLVTRWMKGPPKRTLEMVSWKLSERYPEDGKLAGIPTQAEAMLERRAPAPAPDPQAPLAERGPRPEAPSSVLDALKDIEAAIARLAQSQAESGERMDRVLHALEHSLLSGARLEQIERYLGEQAEIGRAQVAALERANEFGEANAVANRQTAEHAEAAHTLLETMIDEQRHHNDHSRSLIQRVLERLGLGTIVACRREPVEGEPRVVALLRPEVPV